MFVLYGRTPYTRVLVCWQCDGANNGNICTVFYQQDCRFHFIGQISLWIQLIRMRKISIYQIISEQIQVGFDFNPYQRVSLCLLSSMKSVRQKTGSSTDFCLCLCFYLVFAFFSMFLFITIAYGTELCISTQKIFQCYWTTMKPADCTIIYFFSSNISSSTDCFANCSNFFPFLLLPIATYLLFYYIFCYLSFQFLFI